MNRNFFAKALSIVVALPLAVTMPAVTVFATNDITPDPETGGIKVTDGKEHTYEGDITSKDDYAVYVVTETPNTSDALVTIEGNVTATTENSDKIYASAVMVANGNNVDINGDVTSDTYGVIASSSSVEVDNITAKDAGVSAYHSVVDVNGNVVSTAKFDAVEVSDCTVTIAGDVINNNTAPAEGSTSVAAGIRADNSTISVKNVESLNAYGIHIVNGQAKIDGNVTANNYGIFADGNAIVNVDGNVQSNVGYGIQTRGNDEITVTGDVGGYGFGVSMFLGEKSKDASIDIQGTLKGNSAFLFQEEKDANFTSAEDIVAAIPSITIYKAEYSKPWAFSTLNNLDNYSSAIQEALIDSIKYYIHKDENVKINGSEEEPKVMTTKDTLNVSIPEGYDIQVNDNFMNVTQASDGSYVITLQKKILGGIDIKAIKKQIADETGIDESQINVVTENTSSSDSSPVPTDIYGAAAGQIVVTNATSTATPLVEGGKVPSRIVRLDTISTDLLPYKNAIIDNFTTAPAGSSLRIETNAVSVFDKKMIDALAANPTIDVELVFSYGGQKFRVLIPAGYNVHSLLDANGYCGFLRLASLLGSQTIG